MKKTNDTLLDSLQVDIASKKDLDALKEMRPKNTMRVKHVSFICNDCKQLKTLRLMAISSFPVLCRSCRLAHRYDDPNYIEKMKKTNLARYGVEYNSQTKEWKESIKATSIQKYGVKHFSCAPEIREKIHNTTLEHYGAIGFASSEIMEKQRATMIEKYNGYHNMVIPELKEQFFDALSAKYGGVGYAVPAIYEKQKSTMRTRYGIESSTQMLDSTERRKKKYLYNGIYFDSLPEIQYYQELCNSGIPFEYHPKIRFEYFHDNKKHYYFPDFLVNEQYVELKGSQFFDVSDKSNIDLNDPNLHMINPYNRKYDSLADAKFQCMKKHGIKIIIVNAISNMATFLHDNHIEIRQHRAK
jgi:hypothetical protein